MWLTGWKTVYILSQKLPAKTLLIWQVLLIARAVCVLGKDADIIILDDALELVDVYCRGVKQALSA